MNEVKIPTNFPIKKGLTKLNLKCIFDRYSVLNKSLY